MKKEIPPAYSLPKTSNAVTLAIQALDRGEATPDQQKRALNWIIMEVSGRNDQSYRPDPYETAFAEGRRFVGNQIYKELQVNLINLKEKR